MEVAEFFGHKDTRMVEKHYGHLHPDFKKHTVATLDRALPVDETPNFAPKKGLKSKGPAPAGAEPLETLVDPSGIEPLTSTMPLWRSPS